MKALPEAAMETPFQTAALTVCALCAFAASPDVGTELLNFLRGPRPLNGHDISFIKDRFRGERTYIPFSYFAGAVPENAYTPNQPYTVTVFSDAHSYDEQGYARLYIASGGADSLRPVKLMYSQFGWFDIAPDGTELICKDFYFTYPADGEDSENGFYNNQSGLSDPEQAQALAISADAFYQIEAEAANQAQELAMTSFYDYAASHVGRAKLSSDSADGTPVHIQWWNGDVPAEDAYEKLIVDDDAYAADVMFTTEYDVTEFSLMKLYVSDVSDDGTVICFSVPIESPDILAQERPLPVQMTFPGDIPAYGISYTDRTGDGTIHRFTIEISGEDGSLILREMD